MVSVLIISDLAFNDVRSSSESDGTVLISQRKVYEMIANKVAADDCSKHLVNCATATLRSQFAPMHLQHLL